jgi:hypothetical protein
LHVADEVGCRCCASVGTCALHVKFAFGVLMFGRGCSDVLGDVIATGNVAASQYSAAQLPQLPLLKSLRVQCRSRTACVMARGSSAVGSTCDSAVITLVAMHSCHCFGCVQRGAGVACVESAVGWVSRPSQLGNDACC